jgi:hypothetical protein
MIVFANVMFPSIAAHVVVMLLLLGPITYLEGLVLSRRHTLKLSDSLGLSFQANLRSTVIGLPLGYCFAMVGIIPAGVFAALLPQQTGSVVGKILFHALGIGGTIPSKADEFGFYVGTLIVMIPYYLVTIRVERKCLAKLRPELDNACLTTTVRIMNDLTYGLLAIALVVGAIGELLE